MRLLLVSVLALVACRGKSAPPPSEKAVAAGSATAVTEHAAPPKIVGSWRIKEYEVDVPAIADAWLDEYDATFGLTVGVGASRELQKPDASVDIATNCVSSCQPAAYEQDMHSELARQLESNLRAHEEGATIEWVQKPTQLGDRWFMHLRAMRGPNIVKQQAVVVTWDPQASGGFLQCMVDVGGGELARMAPLIDVCKGLRWRRADVEKPFVPPFGTQYVMNGIGFELPTPADFTLQDYFARNLVAVVLRGPNIFDQLKLSRDCNGSCDATEIRANLDRAFAEEAKPAAPDQPPFELVEPVHEVAPRRWVQRRHYAPWRSFAEAVEVTVRAVRPGDDHYMTCTVHLTREVIGRADELQKLCLATLQGW